MDTQTSTRRERRTGRISAAVDYSGISRSSLYEIAKKHPGLFKKMGDSTLVDFDVLDSIIDKLPCAYSGSAATSPEVV